MPLSPPASTLVPTGLQSQRELPVIAVPTQALLLRSHTLRVLSKEVVRKMEDSFS